MKKNYMKVHEGREVPEGAAHYNEGNNCFYNYLKNAFYSSLGNKWKPVSCYKTARDSIELPEAPQEWMPEVGDRIVICFDDVNMNDLNENEIAIDGMEVAFIGSLVNGVGQTIFVYDDDDNFSNCYPSEYFRPLKTAEEKKREAFIEDAAKIMISAANGVINDISLGALFDEGYVRPKEEV